MKPISKRDQERMARREELAGQIASPEPAPSTEAQPAASSASTSPAPSSSAMPSPQVVHQASEQHGDQRAQGAGVSKILGSFKSGLADQLSETKAALASAENELNELRPLKEMVDGSAIPCKELDPATVLPTPFENRDEKSFDPEHDRDFKSLLADIRSKGGNTVPGCVRPLPSPQGKYLYEAVYGHRRHRACLQAGVPFKALIADLSDEEAVLLQQTENTHSKKLSAIERGRQISSYLVRFRNHATGRATDGSLQLLAEALKTDTKQVSRYALIGSIPDDVLALIPDTRDIPYRPALLLARACRDNLKQVISQSTCLPSGAKSRAVVQHLLGTSSAASIPMGRYELSLPSDADDREAVVKELREIELKYGFKFGLKALEVQ